MKITFNFNDDVLRQLEQESERKMTKDFNSVIISVLEESPDLSTDQQIFIIIERLEELGYSDLDEKLWQIW